MALRKLLRKLNESYPQPFDWRPALRKALIAGVFVSLLDLFFQPFGLASFQHPHKTWVLLGFGVPVFLCVSAVGVGLPLLFPSVYRLERWTVWKQIVANTVITFGIGVLMYFYARWVGFTPFTNVGYLVICCVSFAVVITLFFLFTDQNAFLRKQEQRKEQESEELKLLIRESHHRMRNHLQVIASMLRLQTNVVTDARALEALRTSENRLQSVAILHEKLYRRDPNSAELASHVLLRDYLEELTRIIAQHHAELFPNVAIQVEDHVALRVPLDKAVPLGLIVNELVTNSFKHAFQTIDTCCIQLVLDRVDDGRHRLTVRDNGPGIPEALLAQPATAPASSLGLRLIRALTQQLRGELAYQHNGGAEFAVRF